MVMKCMSFLQLFIPELFEEPRSVITAERFMGHYMSIKDKEKHIVTIIT